MTSAISSSPQSRLVWDLPLRMFHWLLVLSFAGAFITAESERWRLVHVTLGYTVAGLIAFRLLWGLIGTRHARFASFVRGPQAVLGYLKSLGSSHPEHHVGHNPAGALAVLVLLALGATVAATGWAIDNEWGGHLLEELHEGLANTMLAVVALHLVGVVASSVLHRENLVRAMFSGRKLAPPAQAITGTRRVLGVALLAAVLGFWTLQWQQAPADTAAGASPGQAATHDRDHDDD